MSKFSNSLTPSPSKALLQEIIVTIATFFYLLFQVRPTLILEIQHPPFILNSYFLKQFLGKPGDITNLLTAFIMQFWFWDLLASLILSIILFLVVYLTRKWIENIFESQNIHTLQCIPATFLIVLYTSYDFRLSIAIALIINLTFLIIFTRWKFRSIVLHIISSVMMSIILYWATGGAFFLFSILLAFHILFSKRQYIYGLLFLIFAIATPYILAKTIFLVTLRTAYLNNLSIESTNELAYLKYLLIIFYPIIAVIAYFVYPNRSKGILSKLRFGKIPFIAKWVTGTLLIIGVSFYLIKNTYNENLWTTLRINKCAHERKWNELLEISSSTQVLNLLTTFQTNFALFQSGKLLDRLFAYPQNYGTKGLLMDFDWSSSWPEQVSDIYWELGLINESLHWAHEALEKKGPGPKILERLGTIYLLKGQNEAARKFLLNLMDVPFHRQTAQRLLRLTDYPEELQKDSTLRTTLMNMPIKRSILTGKSVAEKMEILLERNAKNRMAFEYLIAYHLLNGNFRKIVEYINEFRTLGYTHIPRHVEEALIVAGVVDKKLDRRAIEIMTTPKTFKQFLQYQHILQEYKQDLNSARYKLNRQFGDTYWYYLMYTGRTLRQAAEKQHEYQ